MDLGRELKTQGNIGVKINTNCCWCVWNDFLGPGKRLEKLEIRNTQKRPEGTRRHAVIHTLVKNCCILTFDRADCSSCLNNVIAGRTCVNKRKYIMWVTTRIRRRWEIIYTRSTADTESLAGSVFNLEFCV